MKLNDNVIGHIAQIVQLAILTGTDVVDHMRMIRLIDTEDGLMLDPEYENQSRDNIESMLNSIEEITAE
jgi:hypothetical protein